MVLLCMPVSTATAERSFSKMRRVKTYLRNTMTTERLSGLGLVNIYQDREIHTEQVVDVFARSKDFQGLKISIKLMILITEPNIALKTKPRHTQIMIVALLWKSLWAFYVNLKLNCLQPCSVYSIYSCCQLTLLRFISDLFNDFETNVLKDEDIRI